MVGMVGTATTNLNPDGQIFVNGETWQAISSNGTPIKKGEKVIIVSLDGLRLTVKKFDKQEE
jgi:membrane-bound serine protease (ClpP class)